MRSAFLIKVVFIAVGVALLVGSHSFYKSERAFVNQSLTARGEVKDNVECSGRKRHARLYCPIIEFQTKSGALVTFRHHLGRKPQEFEVGDSVPVVYLHNAPHKAKMDGFFAKWGGTFGLALIGFVFTLIGSLVALWDYNNQKRSNR